MAEGVDGMMDISVWWAGALPLAAMAGLWAGLAARHLDEAGSYDDGYLEGHKDGYREATEDQRAMLSQAVPEEGELFPELPDWTAEQLRALRDDESPGEVTGPFTITDLPGRTYSRAGYAEPSCEMPGRPAGEQHYPSFTSLPLPDEAVLEQEWSWGKVAYQILDYRKWLGSEAWDIPTEVAA
jgi:hypothetical protein